MSIQKSSVLVITLAVVTAAALGFAGALLMTRDRTDHPSAPASSAAVPARGAAAGPVIQELGDNRDRANAEAPPASQTRAPDSPPATSVFINQREVSLAQLDAIRRMYGA